MNLKTNLSCFVLLLIFACKKKESTINFSEENKSSLIEVSEFNKIKSNSNVQLIDFRKPSFYKEGHLLGAINIWRSDIENHSYPYDGMIASKQDLEKLFSKKGISSNDLLVVYDDNGLCDATRFWWVLQNYKYTNVKLLHARYKEFTDIDITKEIPKIKPTSFKFSSNRSHTLSISKEELLKKLDQNMIILDTRTLDEYSGERQKKGAFKGGRIPTSILIDWSTAINFNSDKRLKSKQELDSIYNTIIPSKETPVIVYCHSGVRSSHTTFVLTEILGYENVKNYDGSWIEWSYFDNLPFERDSINTIEN